MMAKLMEDKRIFDYSVDTCMKNKQRERAREWGKKKTRRFLDNNDTMDRTEIHVN